MKLPPGFPVKVDIPVLPTVSARVTFHDFSWKNKQEINDDSSELSDNKTNPDKTMLDSNKNGAFGNEAKNSKDANSKKDKDQHDEAASTGKTKKEKKDKKDKSKKESSQKGEKDAEEDTVDDHTLSEETEDSPYLDDSLFQIPAGYVEDNTRFPDL